MKRYSLASLSQEEVCSLVRRNPIYDAELFEKCHRIFERVERDGDEALREYTQRYDGVELENPTVHPNEFSVAMEQVPADVLDALALAARNIRRFHSAQQLVEKPVQVMEGVTCWRAARAIGRIGLYVPGGTAALPSTVLMLGIPAKLAGCGKIVMTVPPQRDGSIAPSVLAAAQTAGIRQVFKIGGAQAIAALTLGTVSVPRVNKILGPGNRIVQMAKLLATFHGVAIDMVAGPSEVLVIADDSALPAVVASDLIAQAEHGPDSQSVLVSPSMTLIDKVLAEVESQLQDLPRSELAAESLRESFTLLVPSLEEGFTFSNQYAPEHLILSIENAREWLGRVQSAGSVFVGNYTPEVAGDYASGTNHTLPTSGMARADSGVSMDSYVKKISFQELTPQGLEILAPALEALAAVESLDGHARAVRLRVSDLSGVTE